MKKSGMKNFIAAVSDNYFNRIDDVADRLRKHGCEVEQILRITGVIIGRVSHTTDLRNLKIEGIEAIEIRKGIRKIKS
jgi:hypothetical protein